MKADRSCRKLSMGAIPYTPAYSEVRTKIELWTLVIKKLKGGDVDNRFLQRKANKVRIVNPLFRSIQEASERRATAYREEKRLAKRAGNDRKTWLESLAEASACIGRKSFSSSRTKESCQSGRATSPGENYSASEWQTTGRELNISGGSERNRRVGGSDGKARNRKISDARK